MPSSSHQHNKKQKPKIGGYASTLNKRGKLSLVFDPDARKEYLTGFSKRKKERRTFGLAMQKVKDRKAKLAEREEVRKAKQKALSELPEAIKKADAKRLREMGEGGDEGEEEEAAPVKEVQEFDDQFTTANFGDSVTVTTFLGIPQAEEEGNLEDEVLALRRRKQREKEGGARGARGEGMDKEQLHAGSVGRFKKMLHGNLPGKKKKVTKENTSGSFMVKKLMKEKEEGGGKKGKKGRKGRK